MGRGFSCPGLWLSSLYHNTVEVAFPSLADFFLAVMVLSILANLKFAHAC
jgi:hypothetical protein